MEHANNNGIFDLIDHDLVFDNASTHTIKMNHIKTMLCGNFIGIDKLERLKLLQSDPIVNEFNSYSRVNANIPVKIDGNNVTINYNKTTGVKHLLATGSGKIDNKGQMALKVTLDYTLTESCSGTLCTGTESLEMSFSGVADLNGIWNGKATGLVTVNYPNPLGKDGDNSASCNAQPVQAKLRPGFTDTDL